MLSSTNSISQMLLRGSSRIICGQPYRSINGPGMYLTSRFQKPIFLAGTRAIGSSFPPASDERAEFVPKVRPSNLKRASRRPTSNALLPLSGNPALLYYLNPIKMASFGGQLLYSYRYFFIYMARTTFQAVRPLLAFSVMGEVLKMVLATMSSGIFAFMFSFVLAFEVLYFFLQCYISYTFLTMFFTVLF